MSLYVQTMWWGCIAPETLHWFTADRNAKWYSHLGKRSDSFLKNTLTVRSSNCDPWLPKWMENLYLLTTKNLSKHESICLLSYAHLSISLLTVNLLYFTYVVFEATWFILDTDGILHSFGSDPWGVGQWSNESLAF